MVNSISSNVNFNNVLTNTLGLGFYRLFFKDYINIYVQLELFWLSYKTLFSDHCSQNIPQNFIHVTDIGTDMKEFVKTLKSKSLDQISCCAGDFVLRVNGEDILLEETFRPGSLFW